MSISVEVPEVGSKWINGNNGNECTVKKVEDPSNSFTTMFGSNSIVYYIEGSGGLKKKPIASWNNQFKLKGLIEEVVPEKKDAYSFTNTADANINPTSPITAGTRWIRNETKTEYEAVSTSKGAGKLRGMRFVTYRNPITFENYVRDIEEWHLNFVLKKREIV